MKKTCSLQDFMQELTPWLDSDHIHDAVLDTSGHLVLHFIDGVKHVYAIDDCNARQMEEVLATLKKNNIPVSRQQD